MYPAHDCIARDEGLEEARAIIEDECSQTFLMIAERGQVVWGWPMSTQ
jgi:hypothetical protein